MEGPIADVRNMYVRSEMEAHPYTFSIRSTLVGNNPKNKIAADKRMFPEGIWLTFPLECEQALWAMLGDTKKRP